MDANTLTLIISIVTLIFVGLSPIVQIALSQLEAHRERQETQRERRQAYIQTYIDELIALRTEITQNQTHRWGIAYDDEEGQAKIQAEERRLDTKANGMLLAFSDPQIQLLALDIEARQGSGDPGTKEAVEHALVILGKYLGNDVGIKTRTRSKPYLLILQKDGTPVSHSNRVVNETEIHHDKWKDYRAFPIGEFDTPRTVFNRHVITEKLSVLRWKDVPGSST